MARLRLLCVPYAGGGPSAYLSWLRYLPADVELRLVSPPGRDLREDEPSESSADNYVNAVVHAIRQSSAVPYAIFGHSMGALLAHRIALRLSAEGTPPVHLFVSAKGTAADEQDAEALRTATDAQLIAETRRRFGGLPAMLDSEPVIMAAVLLRLRDDLRLMTQLGPQDFPPLSIPLTVMWSPDDHSVSESQIFGWRERTTGPVQFETFAGGHFYWAVRPERVVHCVLTSLGLMSPAPAVV